MSTRPISFIMRAEMKHLDAADLRAGAEHCEVMIQKFEAHKARFEAELKARSGGKR